MSIKPADLVGVSFSIKFLLCGHTGLYSSGVKEILYGRCIIANTTRGLLKIFLKIILLTKPFNSEPFV